MKAKSLSTILFSSLGVLAMLFVLIAINYLGTFAKQRVDLTSDHSFTLSDGTRRIIHKLDTPVTIRFYVTQDNEVPSFIKDYAKRVEDLLDEYQQLDPKHIIVKKLDPQPDSDAEDSAKLDGVEGNQLPNGEKIYLGLSFSMLDQKKAIPMLDPQRERQLEYDITSAISSVITTEKPVIGIMSPLPVAGMNSNPMMAQMGQQGRPAWAFYSQLKDGFTLKDVDMGVSEIPADVKVLVLIHPKALRPGTEFAIDQFVMRGGKLVAFLDPLCVLDQQQGAMGFAPPSNSTFDHLLKAWGITFNVEKVAADMTYCADTRNGKQPAILALTKEAFNKDDIVTADADNAVFPFAGVFSSTSSAGLQVTPLISTSEKSELVDVMEAQASGESVINKFLASGVSYPLAIRLTGTFKTGFPDGAPADTTDSKQPPKPTTPALKQTAQANNVILFGDADFIQDPVAVNEIQNPFGGDARTVMAANGNLSLAQSAVEQMAGDNDLIALRSRGITQRPFTLVNKMEEHAEDEYRDKIQQLQTSLQDTESKLADLQHSKNSDQKFILSPEQQQEITNFRKTEADTRKQLKDMRKSLRADIDSLEMRLKLFNMALMPLIVVFIGIIAGLVKHQRAAAR